MHTEEKCQRIRVKEVAAILGCGVSTVWSWTQKGLIPPPKRVGTRFTFWLRSEIEAVAKDGAISK